MAKDRNPETNAAAFLGAELRRARLSAGLSQEMLARETGFDRTVITKAETGERPPSEDVMSALAEKLSLDDMVARLAVLARKSKGPYPDWFQDWVEAEKVAKVLWYWAPLLVPGSSKPRHTREPFSVPIRTAARIWTILFTDGWNDSTCTGLM